MKTGRVLASTAAAAVMALTPLAAHADNYGPVPPDRGVPVAQPPAAPVPDSAPGVLPSTGSSLLDSVIGGAGLLLLLGGGATVVAARRKQTA